MTIIFLFCSHESRNKISTHGFRAGSVTVTRNWTPVLISPKKNSQSAFLPSLAIHLICYSAYD